MTAAFGRLLFCPRQGRWSGTSPTGRHGARRPAVADLQVAPLPGLETARANGVFRRLRSQSGRRYISQESVRRTISLGTGTDGPPIKKPHAQLHNCNGKFASFAIRKYRRECPSIIWQNHLYTCLNF